MRKFMTSVVAVAGLLGVACAAQAVVLDQDQFDRGSVETPITLHGTSPTSGPGTWQVLGGSVTTDGSIATAAANNAVATLPFPITALQGTTGPGEYTFSMDIKVTGGSDTYLGFSNDVNNGSPGWDPAPHPLSLRFWQDGQFYLRAPADNPNVNGSGIANDWNTIKFVWDTAPANWTFQIYVNNNPIMANPLVYAALPDGGGVNPLLTGVYIYSGNNVLQFDNMNLTVAPEPASLGVIAIGSALLMRRRRA